MEYVAVDGNTAVIAVDNRFDLVKTLKVKKETEYALNQQGCKQIVIDFDKTKFIDSSANKLFKELRKMVGKENIKMTNIHAEPIIRAFKQAKMDVIFGLTL